MTDEGHFDEMVLLDEALDLARSDVRSAARCFYDRFADVQDAELANTARETNVPVRIEAVGNDAGT